MHPVKGIILLTMWFLLVGAVAPGPATADLQIGGITLHEGPQDLTQVTRDEWAWSGGAEKFPVVSFTMNSGRFTYTVRHDQKYGNGGIGLSAPTAANWYQAGMLELFINGKRMDLTPASGEKSTCSSGQRGRVTLSWDNELTQFSYTFVLRAGDNKLFLLITLQPKVKVESLRVHLSNYPSGLTYKPQHVLITPAHTLDKPGAQQLDPAVDNAIFYSDRTLDVATNTAAAGPSACACDNTDLLGLKVWPGGYGVGTDLLYKPTATQLAFCFWEFPRRTNQQAAEYFLQAAPEALKLLADPGTFAP